MVTTAAEHLEHLRIIHCDVEPSAWYHLQRSQLRVLHDVSYKSLNGSIMAFLRAQHRMGFLTFSRPQVIYTEGNLLFFDEIRPHLMMDRVEKAPHLGPGTSWFKSEFGNDFNTDNSRFFMPKSPYPSLVEFGSCLEGMPHLKNLRILSDMYDISL